MGVFNRLFDLFEAEEGQYTYQCLRCGTTWDSNYADASDVSCSACGSTLVRAATDT
jgi:DNA-directed RNA polymerase subunit RPC12/RpoP